MGVGHRYIQFAAGTNKCATTSNCDGANRRATGWKTYWRPRPIGGIPVPKVLPTTTASPEDDGSHDPSTTVNKFCKPDCYTHKIRDWEKKCNWGKCKQCSECVTPVAPTAPPTQDRFCKDDCHSDTKRDWSKKCKWNRCKNCQECA